MVRIDDLLDWFEGPRIRSSRPDPGTGVTTHVVILDGTLSSLYPGHETNAGLTWQLLSELRGPARLSLYYEPGLQWQGWRRVADVAAGRGINSQIRRAYGFLASRYRPGDRIFLFGYSRGAFAVRSLAGMIDRMGLLRQAEATERAVQLLFRHYRSDPETPAARRLARRLCHTETVIEFVGVWDTVKALGLQFPVLWRFTEVPHRFHNHRLGRAIRCGCQALALHETRRVFDPVLWQSVPDRNQRMEQVWFRGAHGDIGGQIGGFLAARPLANIPLVWMLDQAAVQGLPLPEGWRDRLPCDPAAPMVGTWRAWGKLFWMRHARRIGRDPSERIHPSARLPVD